MPMRTERATQKRRVCCFCEKWESGGIESLLYNVFSHMELSGLEIDIVAAELCDSVFTKRLEALGITFRQLSGRQQNVLRNWRMFKALLKERRYDVVHINIFQALSLRYAVLAKQEGVPIRIAHSHNTALRSSKTRWLKLAIHGVSKRLWTSACTDYWVCSQAAAEFMFSRSHCSKEIKLIPNGIMVEQFRFSADARQEMRRLLGLKDELLVGSVGRLCEQKNHAFLLEAFAALLQQRSDSRLLIVGEGELLRELEAQAKRLGINDKVMFYGVSPNVPQLLWAMDVFAFPSRFEGLGIVAVEAQAAGLPVVCSEHVPKEAYVTEQIKAVPLTEGPAAWASAMLELAHHPLPERAAAADRLMNSSIHIARCCEMILVGYGALPEEGMHEEIKL